MDFRFCLHERKKHPFSKSLRPIPFLDIYFCPFSLFQSTFGFSKFCKLYILLILILKEIIQVLQTYTMSYTHNQP